MAVFRETEARAGAANLHKENEAIREQLKSQAAQLAKYGRLPRTGLTACPSGDE